MNNEQIKRLCEYAEDGWNILQVGIQPEVVINLPDRIDELNGLEEFVDTIVLPTLLNRRWTEDGVIRWIENRQHLSTQQRLVECLNGMEQGSA